MDIKTELDNFLGKKRALVDAITREFRSGTPAKAIARTVSPAFSRDQATSTWPPSHCTTARARR
ncbi:hypothetical protein SCYAM73S_06924 [Streptomyces cyaneofuscatus]